VNNLAEENTLIESIISGKKEDYAILVNRYKGFAFSLAVRVLKNREEAEEATQEAFIKAFQHLKHYKKESKFSSWLYRIVYNESINQTRKRKKTESFEIHKFDVPVQRKSDNMEIKDRKKYIDLALNNLPEQDSAIISLFYLQEMNLAEISEIMSLSSNNVKIKLHRARKKMAGALHRILKEESLTL